MIESGYYPPGAEFDPNAPYNEPPEPEPISFKKDFVVTLYQTIYVEDDRYYNDYDGINEDDCDFVQDYEEQMRTPKELLAEYAEILKQQIKELKEKKPRGWKEKVSELNDKVMCCQVEEQIIELE